jgi:hypothetical protein
MSEYLFKTSQGDFFAVEPVDHREEAAAAEKVYAAEWTRYLAGDIPMPHHPYERRISYLNPGREMIYYTKGDVLNGVPIPAKRVTRLLRDASPLNDRDIRDILELPRYYVEQLYDSRILTDEEYNEVYDWAYKERMRRALPGTGFPLYFYGLHRLFKKFIDGKLDLMRQQYSDGTYSWMMFLDPVPHASAAEAAFTGKVKKKQREKFQEIIEDSSGVPQDYVRYCVAQQYGAKFAEITARIDAKVAAIANAKPEDCPLIPNTSSKEELYTHQALALAKLHPKGPDGKRIDVDEAVIDIDVGGGKLRILVYDALLCIKEGRCKRPLLVMPNSTIAQQKDEIERFTGRKMKQLADGVSKKMVRPPKVNVVVINTDTFQKYGLKYWGHGGEEAGRKRFEEIANAMPPNTIYITSYDWLRMGGEDEPEGAPIGEMVKQYQRDSDGNLEIDEQGNPKEIKAAVKVITRYPRAEWLIDALGIDYVALDESHLIKNRSSATGNVALHLGNVKIKRIATGTITPNQPEDLWRQYAFVDPGLFRKYSDFLAAYGNETDEQGKVLKWKRTALSEIRQKMIKHGAVMYRRATWKHRLPKKTETFHQVQLNDNQQAVYKAIILDLQQEIENNPTLKAEWEKFQQDPNAMRDVEAKHILVKLSRLDSFLTAMGQDTGDLDEITIVDEEGKEQKVETNRKFVQTLQGEDKVSPKSAAIDKILDGHFANPKNGKVVVFVQNEISCQHLYDNSKYKDKAGWFMKSPQLRPVDEAQTNLKRWENPDDKGLLVLFAVDKSLRTGRNFQKVCNRVIHADCLWDPGNMDQRIGRIERPKSPFGEGPQADPGIFVDWVVTNNTAETTKFARLLSKVAIVAQVNSGFETDTEWTPITMNPINMGMIVNEDQTPPPPFISWDTIAAHRTLPPAIAVHEDKTGAEFRATYGTADYKRQDPELIHKSQPVHTPKLNTERVAYEKEEIGTPIKVDAKGEVIDAEPEQEPTVEDIRKKKAPGPTVRIDHKLKGGKPILEISHPQSIKNLDPDHIKELGFKYTKIKGQKVLFVHRSSNLHLKRIIQALRDHGYRVDYQHSKAVPHVDTIKDPRAAKEEAPPKPQPERERVRKPKPEENEGGPELEREEGAPRPPKRKPQEDEDEDVITLDDVEEAAKPPVSLDAVMINDAMFYRLREPKGELESELAALGFRPERPHYYAPLRSWQQALFLISRIKKLGITIEDEADVVKAIKNRAVPLIKPKGGFSELEIDKRLPKKRVRGTITLYFAKIDGEPNLGVTDRENTVDLSMLRALGFRPAERSYFWRRMQQKGDLLVILKRMLVAGFKIKNWEKLSTVLRSVFKVSTAGLEGLEYTEEKDQPRKKRRASLTAAAFRTWL